MKKFFTILGCLCVFGLTACDNKSQNEVFMKNLKLSKVADYFYEVYYDDYDYQFAESFNRKYNNPNLGACSSVRNGNFHGRNYDWYYDENVEFIVHTSAKNGRHASVGVATMVPGTSVDFVDSGLYTDGYKILPFRVVDGINDAGVAININVVPFGDMPLTTGTNPDGDDMYFVSVIRYVLDYADSVDSAIELLKTKNIYAMNNGDKHEEGHFMISDPEKTVVVEFINNELVVVENANIMTNFYLAVDKTPHSAGIERFNILRENYNNASTNDGMISLLKSVWYTNAYNKNTTPFWYSEYVGDFSPAYKDVTISSPLQDFVPVIETAVSMFEQHERTGKTWYTTHTSVYDLENKTLTLIPHESGVEYKFGI